MTEEDVPKPLRGWMNHVFSSGCYTGDDYKAFQNEYARWLRKALKGYSVDVHRNHYEFSAVITRKGGNGKPDRHVYLYISDVRFFPKAWYSRCSCAQWPMRRTGQVARTHTAQSDTYRSG